MGVTRFAAAIVVVIGIPAACAPAPAGLSDAHAAAIRDSVEAVLEVHRQLSAVQAWDSVAALYADDSRFRWVEDGAVRYRSAAEIRRAFAALPPSVQVQTTYHDTEIVAVAGAS